MKVLIIILLILPVCAIGQMRVSLRSGYGLYSMNEMKSFQAELRAQSEYPMRITESFPGYVYYEVALMLPLANKFFYTANFGYGSTGGRIHYSDYSGEIRFDQLLNYISAGTSLGISEENSTGKYVFDFSITPSFVFSKLSLEFMARIGDEQNVERIEFRSTNLTLQPDFAITRKFGRLGIQAMVGYNFAILKGKLFLTSDGEAYLIDSSGNNVPSNWNGGRASLGISFLFGNE
jgi:hypothetical protein